MTPRIILLAAAAPLPGAKFPGINGFLGTRASVMLDVVCVALFALLALLGLSIYLVRCRRLYSWHKRIQVTLGTVLLLTVAAFEVDMHYLTQWELRAAPSRYFIHHYSDATPASAKWGSPVGISLLVHLFFAVPTAALWVFVIAQALWRFPRPPRPGPNSARHKFWARLTVFETTMTAVTGWLFYYLAFVA